MTKYKYHSLALTPAEESQFQEIKKNQGFGIKKIFKAMLDTLSPHTATDKEDINQEEEI